MKLADFFNYDNKAYGGDWKNIQRPGNSEALIVFRYENEGESTFYAFDFVMRMVKCRVGTTVNFIPFSQMDPEVLHDARDELIRRGGQPPELPSYIEGPIQKRSIPSGNKPKTP